MVGGLHHLRLSVSLAADRLEFEPVEILDPIRKLRITCREPIRPKNQRDDVGLGWPTDAGRIVLWHVHENPLKQVPTVWPLHLAMNVCPTISGTTLPPAKSGAWQLSHTS